MSAVKIKKVGSRQLFNLPLYEHHLVIDTRPLSAYQEGHIATAVSFPALPLEVQEVERVKKLIEFIKSYIKEYLRPENPSPIVIYGNKEPESQYHGEWLIQKLEQLHKDRRVLSPLGSNTEEFEKQIEDYTEKINYFEQFCNTVADYTVEIWMLECSYEEFRDQYDFLCGHVEFSCMYPVPHQITDNLFLGSRVFPLTQQCLSQLRISHMIVSDRQELDWSELKGISVLKCGVEDSNSQDMSKCWEACCTFIDQALCNIEGEISSDTVARIGDASSPDVNKETRSARILVILFGRSRSTSVILAHMIKTYKMTLENAWDFVREGCWHLIDRSLIYEEQLYEWQKRHLLKIIL